MNSIVKNLLFTLLLGGVSSTLFSQNVAINTSGNSPYTSAILDLSNQNTVGTFGFLPPYVTLTALTTFGLSGTAAQSNGIIVYNTGGAVTAGLYYWNNAGSTWVAIGGGGSISGGTTNYIARWLTATTLGIGVAQDNGTGVSISSTALTPANKLDVNGSEAVGTYAGTAAPANGMIISGRVGVGNNAPAASSIIDLTNTKATGATGEPMLWPTNPNPTANIAAPVLGEEIYNTTMGCFQFYNGTTWLVKGCPCTVAPGTPIISAVGPCSLAVGGSSTTFTSSINTGVTFIWTATASTGTPTITGNGTATVTVTWPPGAGTGSISLSIANTCGASSATLPVTIDGITGPSTVGYSSSGNIYTCTPAGATSYSWSSNSTYGVIAGSTTNQTVSITAASSAGTFTLTCVMVVGGCTYNATYVVTVTTCLSGSAAFACNSKAYIAWWYGSFDSTFYIGSVQTWTVPNCVTSITITAMGAAGGDCDGGPGGCGALIKSNAITVTPGHVISVIVGGEGTEEDVAYGGGGGGGSFVWDNNTSTLLVAAGGGGGGGYLADGTGGNAEIDNTSAATLEATTNNPYNLNGAGGTGGGASSGGAEGLVITFSGQGCGGAGWGESGVKCAGRQYVSI